MATEPSPTANGDTQQCRNRPNPGTRPTPKPPHSSPNFARILKPEARYKSLRTADFGARACGETLRGLWAFAHAVDAAPNCGIRGDQAASANPVKLEQRRCRPRRLQIDGRQRRCHHQAFHRTLRACRDAPNLRSPPFLRARRSGHRQPSNCADTQTLAKPGELTAKTQAKLLDNIKPKGQSPIAAAMSEAAKTTAPQEVKRDIVLVVGAGDSCKSDFCGTAELLKKKSPQMRIHVLAYDAKAMESLAPLTCIAEKSGGTFITAANADEVKQGLTTLFDIASGIPAPPETPSAPVANAAPVPNSNPETVGALPNTSSGRDPGDAGGDEIPLAAPPVPEPGASVMTPSTPHLANPTFKNPSCHRLHRARAEMHPPRRLPQRWQPRPIPYLSPSTRC